MELLYLRLLAGLSVRSKILLPENRLFEQTFENESYESLQFETNSNPDSLRTQNIRMPQT